MGEFRNNAYCSKTIYDQQMCNQPIVLLPPIYSDPLYPKIDKIALQKAREKIAKDLSRALKRLLLYYIYWRRARRKTRSIKDTFFSDGFCDDISLPETSESDTDFKPLIPDNLIEKVNLIDKDLKELGVPETVEEIDILQFLWELEFYLLFPTLFARFYEIVRREIKRPKWFRKFPWETLEALKELILLIFVPFILQQVLRHLLRKIIRIIHWVIYWVIGPSNKIRLSLFLHENILLGRFFLFLRLISLGYKVKRCIESYMMIPPGERPHNLIINPIKYFGNKSYIIAKTIFNIFKSKK